MCRIITDLKTLPLKKRFIREHLPSFEENEDGNGQKIVERPIQDDGSCYESFDHDQDRPSSLFTYGNGDVTMSKLQKVFGSKHEDIILHTETMISSPLSSTLEERHQSVIVAHKSDIDRHSDHSDNTRDSIHSAQSSSSGEDKSHHERFRSYYERSAHNETSRDSFRSIHSNLSDIKKSQCDRSDAVLRCMDCYKSFYTENSLRVHVRRHLNKKLGRYRCNQCGQTFSQRSGQVSHIRVHTREKPYSCETCDRKFSDFSTFTKHKRVHTGEKPYRCPVCMKSFTQSGNMHRHMRVVHVEKMLKIKVN